MQIVQFVLVAVEVISSLLLIIIILVQKSKSEGLGLAFGSGMGEALFGSRAGNVLTKPRSSSPRYSLANTLLSIVAGSRGGRSWPSAGRMAAPMAAPAVLAAGQQAARRHRLGGRRHAAGRDVRTRCSGGPAAPAAVSQ